MSVEEATTNCIDYTVPELKLSRTARALFIFTGVILPVICFGIGYPDQPAWQSGNIADFARLLLSHKSTLPFYPFLLYNLISMTLIVYKPAGFAVNTWVRYGIYSGVAVGIFYWCVFMFAFSTAIAGSPAWRIIGFAVYSSLGVCIPWIVIKLLQYAIPKYHNIALLLLFPIICCCIGFPPILIYGLFFFLFCSTSWAVTSYATMTFILLRHQEDVRFRYTLSQLLGMTTWFAGFFAAWRVSYLIVLQEYSKLPTTAPECYICTAAARGHKHWVSSEECITENGEVFRVNNQMRCFKAFELLILTINPKFHRVCRKTYDTIGPPLADFLKNSIFADLTYSTLKPAEWLCRGLLYIITKDTDSCFRLLYRIEKK